MVRRRTRLSVPYASFWPSNSIRYRSRFAALLLLLISSYGHAEIVSSRHWALFNTACARCHEAQCSGRLSLGQDDARSRAHVERYAGNLTDDLHQQLFSYLQHMKEFCGFAAIPLSFESRTVWSEAELASFHSPNGEAYFVPLGELVEGKHRLQVRLTGGDWSAQVVSATFDILAEAASCGAGEEFGLEFTSSGGMHYLRVMGRKALLVQELRLGAAPGGAH